MSEPLISIFQGLMNRSATALAAADKNNNGVIEPAEQAHVPADLRPLTASVASQLGGSMPIDTFQGAYSNWLVQNLLAADTNKDYALQDTEMNRLPAPLYNNIVALRAEQASAGSTSAPAPFGIQGTLGPAAVVQTVIQNSQLSRPTGLAFHPSTGSLYVLNRDSNSTLIIDNPGQAGQSTRYFYDYSSHYNIQPTAIAFSRHRNEFATTPESTNNYGNHAHHGNMFTGPTLWPGSAIFDGGTNSHLDMLHHSPLAMGIAAGKDSTNREYWVFNGASGSIDRYWFMEHHGPGGTDHSDGLTVRYGTGQVRRVPGVPSHLAYDAASDTLYIADTGNGRIAKLDAGAPLNGAQRIGAHHNETPLWAMPGSPVSTLGNTAAHLTQPSGLILHEGHLVASDYATGHIKVFKTDGTLVGSLDTGRGANAITGLAAGPDGRLYVLDARRNEVVAVERR